MKKLSEQELAIINGGKKRRKSSQVNNFRSGGKAWGTFAGWFVKGTLAFLK